MDDALDRKIYGVSYETEDGQARRPEDVGALGESVNVEFDPEHFYSEKKRIKQMMRDDPLNLG